MSDPSVSTTLRPVKATPPPASIEDGASAVFDRALGQPGAGRSHLLGAFEDCLRQFTRGQAAQEGVRDISKAAALSTARCHGNIIETGRILLGGIDELGGALGLELRRCKEDALLGLAEGACQVGPIVYGRFLDIANEYRDNADEWILKNKRRPASFDPSTLPVIVPFEAELTIRPKVTAPAAAPGTLVPSPEVVSEDVPVQEVARPVAKEQSSEPVSEKAPEASAGEWSRPKSKGFFRRLSDVMGGLFGRR